MGRINPQDLVSLAFRIRPNSEYIVFEEQRLTRRQVYAKVRGLAAGLHALGIRKGDRVVSLLPSCPEAIYAAFLSAYLGTVSVPLNPLLCENEVRHILADCGATVVLTTSNWYGQKYLDMLERVRADLPDLRYVILRDDVTGDGRSVYSMQEVIDLGRPMRRVKVAADDPVMISYTSGTTGQAKGVVHTQSRSWGLAVRSAGQRLDLTPLRCLLLPFPPHHYAGLLGIDVTLLAGGKVVAMDRFDPVRMLEYIEKERVTQIGASPTIYRWLLRTPGQEKYDLSSVMRLTMGAEPCPPDLAQALYERLGCNLENFYGTTESRLISWTGLDDSWERAATTVGKPVPGARVRIVDDERRELPVGAQGEIAVQTSQMMSGYHGDPELTSQCLDAEGWFYTGDVGYLGSDGYLRLVDRKKDLIIRGGENVSPAEVEAYLIQHPAIRRAGVIGVPGRVSGEVVWTYLELVPGTQITVKEVLDFCRGQIAPFKIPEVVRFVEELPVSATGKVRKFMLREMAAKELAQSGLDLAIHAERMG